MEYSLQVAVEEEVAAEEAALQHLLVEAVLQ